MSISTKELEKQLSQTQVSRGDVVEDEDDRELKQTIKKLQIKTAKKISAELDKEEVTAAMLQTAVKFLKDNNFTVAPPTTKGADAGSLLEEDNHSILPFQEG